MIKSSIKYSPALIWALTLCCSAVLVLFAYHMYPVPDGDAIGPVPAIKAYAMSGILQNKLFLVTSTIDPSGLGRYLAYPPGVPLFFGSLMSFYGGKSYQDVLVLLSLVRSASAFVFAKLLIITIRRRPQPLKIWDTVLALSLVASNAFFLFASNGRSEILSIFITTFSLWAAISISEKFRRHIVIQICVALLFPVSIANGLIGACLYCIYSVFDVRNMRKRIFSFFLLTFISVIIFTLSYVLVGVPLRDGVEGIMLHARSAVAGYSLDISIAKALSYYKTWLIFGCLASVQFMLNLTSFFREKSNSLNDKLILALPCVVLSFFIYYFGGRFASQHYNLYAFLPIYQYFSFQLASNHSRKIQKCKTVFLKFLLWLAIIISLLQPVQIILLFPYYLLSGSSYAVMKDRFEKIDTQNCHTVYSTGIAMLDEKQSGSQYQPDNVAGIVPTERMKIDISKNSCVIAFVQEVNGNSPPPRGMQLIADYGDRSSYTRILRSIRLLNNPKGYSFRAYKSELSAEAF